MSFEFYDNEVNWQPSNKEVDKKTMERIKNFGKMALVSKTYE